MKRVTARYCLQQDIISVLSKSAKGYTMKLFCLGMPITGDVTRAEQKEGNRDNCPMAGGTGSGNQAEIGMERQRCNWQREHRK